MKNHRCQSHDIVITAKRSSSNQLDYQRRAYRAEPSVLSPSGRLNRFIRRFRRSNRRDNVAARRAANTPSPVQLLRLDAASAWPPLGTCVHERALSSRRERTRLCHLFDNSHIGCARVSSARCISSRRTDICNTFGLSHQTLKMT